MIPRLPFAPAALMAAVFILAGCATAPRTGDAAAAGAQADPRKAATPASAPGAAPPAAAASAPAGASAGASAGAATGARPPAGAAPVSPPGSPQPFATVIKDAKKTDGLFTVWQKDDKVWLELRPEDFDKPFFLSPKIARGIGEMRLYGGSMASSWGRYGRPQIVQFRKVHNQVRLLAVNTEFIAQAGTPEARAVSAAFSPSLLSSTPVASQPHPERKTVLVEANALFVNDMLGLGMALSRGFRQGYSFDARHSGIDRVRAKADLVVFEVTSHYATPSLSFPTPGAAPPGAPAPTTPAGLPDARSMFFGLHYSLGSLPEVPMTPRRADARVGHFTTNVQDFTSDLARTPKQRFANRWRLEKKDPAAALSEPVKPITYWLDKTIPVAYRGAITEGILEWNKAFEKIGFKNAIVVRQQPDDADFDTLDLGVASVRWMTNSQPSFGAIGPSHMDPRTGEILDADIGFESLSSRSLRATRAQVLGKGFTADWGSLLQAADAVREGLLPGGASAGHVHGEACLHGDHAAEQMSYALDVLEARGELDPSSPDVQQFVLDYLKDVTMHEVGHTLGLRHNFRSSRIYTEQQLSDEAFTRANSLAGSVMEYAPINLPRSGQKGGTAWQLALGPYDFWAIEYAYKPLDPKDEAAELQRIASRNAERELAYGTDEDNSLGIDPESLTFDLGDDPVAFAKKRFDIGRDLISRQESRVLKPEVDYSVLRRSVTYAVRDMGRAAGILARQIGGVRTLRDHPGTGRDPLQPVSAAVQREALEALSQGVMSADSLKLSPALQRKLAPSFEDRTDALFGDMQPVETDFSIDAFVTQLRKALLAQLTSDGVASRLLDSVGKLPPGEAFPVSELYARLRADIWSELAAAADIAPARRELQREHLNRIAGQILRPTAARADTRSLMRAEALALQKNLKAAAARPQWNAEVRAHLQDSLDLLSEALAAKMQRAGL
jgi:hypothetical protein